MLQEGVERGKLALQRRQIDVAEQLALSIVAAAHAPSPNLVGGNESWSPGSEERLFQQPASS